jgi:hypothetical protein
MNKAKRLTLSFVLVLALLAIPTMLAAAKELSSLTISGPGIQGEVSLSGPEATGKLTQIGFFNTTSFVQPPENLGQGYNLTAYLNLDGKIVPWLQMVYYPAADGQSGYMHWTGRLNGDTMQLSPADEWSRVSPMVGQGFRDLLAEHGVTLQVAVPASEAAAQPASAATSSTIPFQPSALTLALIGAGLIVVAGGLVWRRRALGHRRASGD